jgi:hypothetical protein
MHELLRIYGRGQAGAQFEAAEILSAEERRVKWLVQAAKARNRDIEFQE